MGFCSVQAVAARTGVPRWPQGLVYRGKAFWCAISDTAAGIIQLVIDCRANVHPDLVIYAILEVTPRTPVLPRPVSPPQALPWGAGKAPVLLGGASHERGPPCLPIRTTQHGCGPGLCRHRGEFEGKRHLRWHWPSQLA